jgi:Zn-dependent peptidase ImmA (M78 family)/transcriptional regulator with XRE-family HTH domain
MTVISLQPSVLKWARERAGLPEDVLAKKMSVKPERVREWETVGALRFKQAEKLAQVTHTPFGFLFLPAPPEERLPIPDFRTVTDAAIRRPSPDLLETVHLMQRRQAWMREFLLEEGEERLPFVGSATRDDSPDSLAAKMREVLQLAPDWASRESSWDNALRRLRERSDAVGVLVVSNGVVGNNWNRKLDVAEFRGFALCDDYAPLIFINGADAKAAQIFTLAHELAHLWLGEDGVSNPTFETTNLQPTERLCNQAAAEFLVPAAEMKRHWIAARRESELYQYLARKFKVSSLVVARRALDLELTTLRDFLDFYSEYQADDRRKPSSARDGGDFWNNQNVRVGRRFGEAVVRAVMEGRLLYREAYQLTGLHGRTFNTYAERLSSPPK